MRDVLWFPPPTAFIMKRREENRPPHSLRFYTPTNTCMCRGSSIHTYLPLLIKGTLITCPGAKRILNMGNIRRVMGRLMIYFILLFSLFSASGVLGIDDSGDVVL